MDKVFLAGSPGRPEPKKIVTQGGMSFLENLGVPGSFQFEMEMSMPRQLIQGTFDIC